MFFTKEPMSVLRHSAVKVYYRVPNKVKSVVAKPVLHRYVILDSSIEEAKQEVLGYLHEDSTVFYEPILVCIDGGRCTQ